MLVYYDTKTGKRLDAIIDFGSIMPGQTKKESFVIQNTFDDAIELKPYARDPDLKILEYPKKLTPGKTGILNIEFSPKPNRVTPLNAEFGFEVVIG